MISFPDKELQQQLRALLESPPPPSEANVFKKVFLIRISMDGPGDNYDDYSMIMFNVGSTINTKLQSHQVSDK